jgi:peptide chain release factor 1
METAIVEIRAGVGGEEAALFARDLFRMYSKYAQKKGWKLQVINLQLTDLGGTKEVVFEVSGNDALKKMEKEAGVHRVQRVPITEKSNRIHTSTVTVAVLPKPKPTEIKIRPEDIKMEFFKSSGPGGQYVNKRMTAVRVTHIPTNITVTCQTERSLQQNKESALSLLQAKILEKEREEMLSKIGQKRKEQIGFGERAEKIRTYNFPQDRVTDHRIKKSWHDIEDILDGNLDKIFEALSNWSSQTN